ncbi:hypothetical protein B0H14DRAFT_3175155 [Mycena olivaceomarginata]|nr:hypothetical protein B0H14DRAFT_3175155 [Mycena olivaceomarginata]
MGFGVFLGALIVASKYLNDSTLKNVHWALCTEIFGKSDIGLVEREFLEVLDFQLSVIRLCSVQICSRALKENVTTPLPPQLFNRPLTFRSPFTSILLVLHQLSSLGRSVTSHGAGLGYSLMEAPNHPLHERQTNATPESLRIE